MKKDNSNNLNSNIDVDNSDSNSSNNLDIPLSKKEQEFIKTIKRLYKGIPIVRFKDIAKKVVVVSSVRGISKPDADFYDYEELSFSRVDKYGVATTRSSKDTISTRKPRNIEIGPVSKEALKSLTLKPNELLISYRGSRHFGIARVGSSYDKIVVGAVSNVRVKFGDDVDEDTSIQIQEYLDSFIVQSYLLEEGISKKRDAHFSRYTLKIPFLEDLPMPDFRVKLSYPYKTLFKSRRDMISISKDILSRVTAIDENTQKWNQSSLRLYLTKNSEIPKYLDMDKERIAKLKALQGAIDDIFA